VDDGPSDDARRWLSERKTIAAVKGFHHVKDAATIGPLTFDYDVGHYGHIEMVLELLIHTSLGLSYSIHDGNMRG
jgi:hypothetical protein